MNKKSNKKINLQLNSQPAIVVVTFNRANSLKRLLASIENAIYQEFPNLIISIDYSDQYQKKLNRIAEDFKWQGGKNIILQKRNLGLKRHIFSCAELTRQYESIILLEDDLVVSPGYYDYAVKALRATSQSAQVAGISLYKNSFNESVFLPFEPIKAQSDFFLMKVPCSWGQIWTKEQWQDFKNWYDNWFYEDDYKSLPAGIAVWPEKSWKKPFFVYLHQNNKYFVYPYVSYSMNLNEPGTNIIHKDFKFLNPLALSGPKSDLFFHEDSPMYSASYFLTPEYINRFVPQLSAFNYTVDFFGDMLHTIGNEDWIITCLTAKNAELSFGLELKPIEINIILQIKGDNIKLVKKKHIISRRLSKRVIFYNYPVPNWHHPYFQKPLKDILLERMRYYFKKIY